MTVGELREIFQRFDADIPVQVEHSTFVESKDATVVVNILGPSKVAVLRDDNGDPYIVIDVTDEAEPNRQGATL